MKRLKHQRKTGSASIEFGVTQTRFRFAASRLGAFASASVTTRSPLSSSARQREGYDGFGRTARRSMVAGLRDRGNPQCLQRER